MLLELTGHEVYTAHDGRSALDAAEQHRPDVVLLDIGLPALNGHEVCRRIRQQPWGKAMVLIALTGWGQDEDRRRSQEAGFDGHLVKPVDHTRLLALLGLSDRAPNGAANRESSLRSASRPMIRSGRTSCPAGTPRPRASIQMPAMPSRCGPATSHSRLSPTIHASVAGTSQRRERLRVDPWDRACRSPTSPSIRMASNKRREIESIDLVAAVPCCRRW